MMIFLAISSCSWFIMNFIVYFAQTRSGFNSLGGFKHFVFPTRFQLSILTRGCIVFKMGFLEKHHLYFPENKDNPSKMMVSNRNLLFQGSIFRCHVNFWGVVEIQWPWMTLNVETINRETSKKKVKGSAMEASPLPKNETFYRGDRLLGLVYNWIIWFAT